MVEVRLENVEAKVRLLELAAPTTSSRNNSSPDGEFRRLAEFELTGLDVALASTCRGGGVRRVMADHVIG